MNVEKWLHFPCFFREWFGISCPMCGFQRAVLHLLRGEIWECVTAFPPFFPLCIAIIWSGLTLLRVGTLRVKSVGVCWWVVVALLIFNAVYQNMPHRILIVF